MEIPARIRIPVCIEQGSVFNFRLDVDGPGRESKNRYFVVLNRDPKTDTVLIFGDLDDKDRKKEGVRAK